MGHYSKRPTIKQKSVDVVRQRLCAEVLAEGSRLRTMGRTMRSYSSRAIFDNLFRGSLQQRAVEISDRARSRSPQLRPASSVAQPAPLSEQSALLNSMQDNTFPL